MRSFAILAVLVFGACDLQPPPKKSASEPSSATGSATPPADVAAAPAPTAPAAAPAADGAPSAPPVAGAPTEPLPPVTHECLQVASHIADVMIRETTDPAQKAALEQDKTKIVRRSAEGCTRDAWPDTARACFLAATTVPAMQECGRTLKAP